MLKMAVKASPLTVHRSNGLWTVTLMLTADH